MRLVGLGMGLALGSLLSGGLRHVWPEAEGL